MIEHALLEIIDDLNSSIDELSNIVIVHGKDLSRKRDILIEIDHLVHHAKQIEEIVGE